VRKNIKRKEIALMGWWEFPEWELLAHTRQFSQEWQTQDLRDTENERVRNRLKTKNGI